MEGTRRAYGAQKKSLNDALVLIAQNKSVNHPRLLSVQTAKMINMYSGGTVIAPWEVDQLDDEWIDVFFGIADLPELRNHYQAFEKRLAERRRQHPNYRKYLS